MLLGFKVDVVILVMVANMISCTVFFQFALEMSHGHISARAWVDSLDEILPALWATCHAMT